jgi:hypothetical protein
MNIPRDLCRFTAIALLASAACERVREDNPCAMAITRGQMSSACTWTRESRLRCGLGEEGKSHA